MSQIIVNGEPKSRSAKTVAELIRAEGLDPTRRGIAVALNGALVPRADWTAAALADGDRVEIVRPVSGG